MTVNNNNVVNNKLIDILQYCESIISDTEEIQSTVEYMNSEILTEEYLSIQDFQEIRQCTENIESIISLYDIDNNESLSEDDIEEIEENRVTIYQYSKYILDDIIESNDTDNHDIIEIINYFKDISYSVSIISDLIESV